MYFKCEHCEKNFKCEKGSLTKTYKFSHSSFTSITDDSYLLCLFNVKATCEADTIASYQDVSKSDCEKRCNDTMECQFIFFAKKFENCVLFHSCDKMVIVGQVGNTYAKEKCHGMSN